MLIISVVQFEIDFRPNTIGWDDDDRASFNCFAHHLLAEQISISCFFFSPLETDFVRPAKTHNNKLIAHVCVCERTTDMDCHKF